MNIVYCNTLLVYMDPVSSVGRAQGLCYAATEISAVHIPLGTVCLSVVKITAKWGIISHPMLQTKEEEIVLGWMNEGQILEWLYAA